MPENQVELVFPGDPFIFPIIEREPVPSRYSGKMLRRLRVGVRARDDEANEELEAALQGIGGESAVIPDRSGSHWKVGDRSYSYQQGQPPGIQTIDLEEEEQLNLGQIDFEGLSLIPDQWSFGQWVEATTLTFLTTVDAETHQRFEQALERSYSEEEPRYFPFTWVGIREDPVPMRFGKCLWERRDDGGARHRIVLVTEEGDDQEGGFSEVFEPERSRLMQQAVIVNVKLDALIEELRQVGVLGNEAIARVTQKVAPLPFVRLREFDRVDDVDPFFH